MDIALLNVRITIQKQKLVVDDIGNHTNTWADWYSCYATVSSESPNENTDAGVVVDNSKIDFTIRWCQNASKIAAETHRVIFQDAIYNILGVDHMNFKKKCVKLKCQKVRR